MPAVALTALEREEIRLGIVRGDDDAAIAVALGRHRCTIGRELARNGGRDGDTATAAEARAVACRARPKSPLLATDRDLGWWVTKRLLVGDSPMTISIELARGTHERTAKISHETIYQAIYQPARSGLPNRAYKLLHRRRRGSYQVITGWK